MRIFHFSTGLGLFYQKSVQAAARFPTGVRQVAGIVGMTEALERLANLFQKKISNFVHPAKENLLENYPVGGGQEVSGLPLAGTSLQTKQGRKAWWQCQKKVE